MRNNLKRLTSLALAISFALILSFIESRIPTFVAIPGVKVGLANIAVIFMLYKFGIKEAIIVSLIRVVMVSLLFGTSSSEMTTENSVLDFRLLVYFTYPSKITCDTHT